MSGPAPGEYPVGDAGASGLQVHALELQCCKRPSEQVALHLVAAERLHAFELRLRLDAFGDDRQPERRAHRDDRRDDGSGIAGVGRGRP